MGSTIGFCIVEDVVDQVELLRLGGATLPGLTDGKEVIGRWTEGSKAGTGFLGLRPIKGVKSGLMRGGDGCLWVTLNGHEAGNSGYGQGLA